MPHDDVFIFVGLLHPRKRSLLLCSVRYFLSFWVGFASGWAPLVASCPMAASVHCPISWTWPPGQSLQWFRTFANFCVPVTGAVTHDHGRSRMIAANHCSSIVKKYKRFRLFLVGCAGGFDFLPISQSPVANGRRRSRTIASLLDDYSARRQQRPTSRRSLFDADGCCRCVLSGG